MNVETTDASVMIKFSALRSGAVFRSKFGATYMKTSLHHCKVAGEFRTNCISLGAGLHSCYWYEEDDVIPCLKVTLTNEG
jgi:hypothetical protein